MTKTRPATKAKAKPVAKPKAKAPTFTTDVLETFAFGEEGILCLTVTSNEDKDLRCSVISLCEEFSTDDPRDTFTKNTWTRSRR